MDFNNVLELNPKKGTSYSNRGRCFYSKGDYKQSIFDLNKAMELMPEDSSAYDSRGNAYSKYR